MNENAAATLKREAYAVFERLLGMDAKTQEAELAQLQRTN
ncbi:MAG: hypothetical protein JWR16_2698, partial [Nevskia sp.]|nr:hypothetical protein [Nevskia sp.]